MKKWFIPGNVSSSKNSRVFNAKMKRSFASPAVQKWKRDSKPYWKNYKQEFLDELEGLEKPYLIVFTFVRKTRHKFDYINPAQTIQDEMVYHGWIEDDNADEMIPVFTPYIYDKENPGVYISILKD